MPRLRNRACQEGEDHLAAESIKFVRLSRARLVLKLPFSWAKNSIFQQGIQAPFSRLFFRLRGSRAVYSGGEKGKKTKEPDGKKGGSQ